MTGPRAKLVESIFLELAELPRDQHEALLDARCNGDAEVRERVRKLLAADAANATDGTLGGVFARGGGAVAEFPHDDPAPQRIGAYSVHSVVGEGGMGAVFDATHDPTGRRAAVKLVRAGLSSTRARERMRIEAELLGRLNAPGIAQVYDAGVAEVTYADATKAHRPFIAMEFVEGSTIVQYAQSQHLSIAQRLHLIEQVARAVHHAHQRGVIHRDLKPSNILVTPDGTAKVVDFGIARLIDLTADGITATGQVLGTIRYMSPEQAAGDQAKVDTRADVYALGAILYELLAERPLVETSTGSSLGAMVQLLNSAPSRLASLKPQLRGDVDAIVHKAIEREPEDRYGSALALADDLHRYLHGQEVTARAPTTVERFVRTVRRNKALSSAVAVAVLAVVAGTFVSIWQARVAIRQAHEKTVALDEAQSAVNYLTDILASCTPERDGRDARVLDVAVKAAADIQERFKDRPLVLASVQLALGRTFLALSKSGDAVRETEAAFQTRARLLGLDDRLTVEAEMARDEAVLAIGGGVELGKDYDRPAEWFETHLGANDRQTLRAKIMLADARARFGTPKPSFELLEASQQTFARVYGPEDDDTLDATASLGFWLIYRMTEPYRAIDLLRPLIEIQSRKFGPDNARTLFSMQHLGGALSLTGQHERAIALIEPRLPTFIQVFGDDHPSAIFARWILAGSYRETEQFDKAQPLYERAITSAAKTFGDGDGRTQTLRIRLAEMWLSQGRIDDAERVTNVVVADEIKAGVAVGHLANALTLQGRITLQRRGAQAALPILERAVASAEAGSQNKRRSPEQLEAAYWLGVCLMDLKRPADAIPRFKYSLDGYTFLQGEKAKRTVRARESLNAALAAAGQK